MFGRFTIGLWNSILPWANLRMNRYETAKELEGRDEAMNNTNKMEHGRCIGLLFCLSEVKQSDFNVNTYGCALHVGTWKRFIVLAGEEVR
jgi:hypothetical protein